MQRFDITIVGAGIAGGTLAAALAGHGLRICVLEAQDLAYRELPVQPALDNFDSRVSALTPRSRAQLQRLDVWEAIDAYRHCRYTHMSVWDAEGTGSIDFDCAEVDAPALGYIVENRAITGALLEKLRAAAEVTLRSPERLAACHRLECGALQLQLESGSSIEPGLLVAADGALSRVRDMLGFGTREWDYGHRAIVATVQVERPHEATAWQRFLPSGPLAFLPLPGSSDGHFCSIVWSIREELADDLLAAGDAEFCARLQRAFEFRLGRVLGASPRYAFPLRQRHALDYVQPGVALVGDAAHTIHPLAGQGINLGLQDVDALAAEILAARQRGQDPSQLHVLKRYQRRRKGENLLMMTAMDGFKRLFEQDALPLRWLRNTGMRGVDAMGPLKQQLMRHAMGL